MTTRTALRLIAVAALAAFPASAFAQAPPLGQWVNPLDGALPGAGEGAKDQRRIDNSKIARRIITCTDLKLGWAVVEVQSIDKESGTSIVRYRKVVEVQVEADNGTDAVVLVTFGPSTPWVKLHGTSHDDGPATSGALACKLRITSLELLIDAAYRENKPATELLAEKQAVEAALKALGK